MTSIANVNSVTINSVSKPFYNNRTITSVDLGNAPCTNNSMYEAFMHCINLTTVTNINSNVTDMTSSFYNCSSLVTAPIIPNSVTNMYQTFHSCSHLTTVPVIPSSAVYMGLTFYNCNRLTTVPTIPASVTNMWLTFRMCSNLTGDIFIESNQVSSASDCFIGASLPKNVYIPFTYSNGVNTKTYNSFVSAGYKTDGSVSGVYLKDIGTH